MILIIGLGNPGPKYQNNRHNVGHMFINYVVNELTGSRINELKLIKTDCFMNVSGIFVKKIIKNYKLNPPAGGENLIVVHDDLDIPLGKFHLQFASGPQLHNGLESIEQNLKTNDFWRLRIGVDARIPEIKIRGETYALQNFLPEEKKQLNEEIFPKIFSQLKIDLKNIFQVKVE